MGTQRLASGLSALLAVAATGAIAAAQQPGEVIAQARLSVTPGFADSLDPEDQFGAAVADLGDLDGDHGFHELLVGAPGDKVTGSSDTGRGCALVIFRSATGVKSFHRIGAADQVLPGVSEGDQLGRGVAYLGDLDGDGRIEVALGQPESDFGPSALPGRVWIVSLEADGSMAGYVEIGAGLGGFTGTLAPRGQFGWSVAALGDLDGDGVTELAVGSPLYDQTPTGNGDVGAVWILFLDASGHVKSQRLLTGKLAGVGTQLKTDDFFGSAVAGPGDLDLDGVPDLVAGAPGRELASSGSPPNTGVVFTLLLNPDGSVKQLAALGGSLGDPPVALTTDANFGSSLAAIGDIDGNGVTDVVAGSPGDPDGMGPIKPVGALWVLELRANGTLKGAHKISTLSGGLTAPLSPGDQFGAGLAAVGGLAGPGMIGLAVGAMGDVNDLPLGSNNNPGAIWLLQLDADSTVQAWEKLGDETPGFENTLNPNGVFGVSAAALGDIDGDGVQDLAVGAPGDADGYFSGTGAVFILRRNVDGTVKNWHKLDGNSVPGIGLELGDAFGTGVAALGDLNGDGNGDIAVCAPQAGSEGAAFILFLDDQGELLSSTRIAPGENGFVPPPNLHGFGRSVGAMPDLDGDGVPELLSAMNLSQVAGQTLQATILVMFLAPDGSVRSTATITQGTPGFDGKLWVDTGWWLSFAALGDLDDDGHPELAVGSPSHGSGLEQQYGIVWIFTLGPDGGVLGVNEIANNKGGFPSGQLDFLDRFGTSVAALPDIDGDGVRDLAVGAAGEEGTIFNHENSGGLWILRLKPNLNAKAWQLIADTTGGFIGPPLDPASELGHALAVLQDGDEVKVTAGAPYFRDGGSYQRGELWTLTLATGGDPWVSLGQGLAGINGAPKLTGSGTLEAGTNVELSLTYPAAFAPTTLVLGLSQGLVPFKGGVLVPTPNVLIAGLVTDALGALVLQSTFPPGVPSGTTLILQAWMAGVGGPKGFVASNGLSGLVP